MKEKSLYIHIPFCKEKCYYCDFPSFSGKEYLMDCYMDALEKEINARVGDTPINTIFIGGGTPTYLHLKSLKKLSKIMEKINFSSQGEFTIECNPGTLNEEKLKVMKDMGINRISMGLQASQDNLLKILGRIHDYSDFQESFFLARREGFNNINVDLMFGLPNQSMYQWEETLNKVTTLEPEHISAYSLIIEEQTKFHKMFTEDKLNLPDEDLEREMYRVTIDILKTKGYRQYEISNFSKEEYQCKHNLTYWNLEEYIGVGAAAHSYDNNKRIKNYISIDKYIENMMKVGSATQEVFVNSIKDNMEEFMFMGLRKIDGVDEGDFANRFETTLDEVYGDVIKKHISNELLYREDNRLALTPRGIELSNYVMKDFIF